MACPLCGNKPLNCDCSADAISLHEQVQILSDRVDALEQILSAALSADISTAARRIDGGQVSPPAVSH